MKIERRIKLLEAELEQLKKEPGVNWLGKWAKSIQSQKLEKKIRELKKEAGHH